MSFFWPSHFVPDLWQEGQHSITASDNASRRADAFSGSLLSFLKVFGGSRLHSW